MLKPLTTYRHFRCAPPALSSALAALPLIFVLLSTIACNGGAHPDRSLEQHICIGDNDCPSTLICHNNYCTSDLIEHLEIGLTFIPPTSSNLAAQSMDSMSVATLTPLQVALEANLSIQGMIAFSEASIPAPDGILIFKPLARHESLFSHRVEVQNGQFSASILPGTYQISFDASDHAIPRQVWPPRSLSSDTILDLNLPQPRDFVRVSGNITYKNTLLPVDIEQLPQEPVANARVMAIAKNSEHASTISYTDEQGWFEIFTMPESGEYSLLVTPTTSSEPIPEVVIHNAFQANTSDIIVSESIGAYRATAVPITFQLQSSHTVAHTSTAPPQDWTGTSIIARGAIGLGLLHFDIPVTADGIAQVSLLPTTYKIDVIPAINSSMARTTVDLDALRSASMVTVDLPLKKKINGIVRDQDGMAVGNVKVRFQPINTATQSASGEETRITTTTTNASGHFAAWLEDTAYLVSAIPMTSSGLARAFTTLAVQDMAPNETVAITLPDPRLIYGTLLNSRLEPAAHVTIQAFEIADGQKRVIGETQSTSTGTFNLIIPAKSSH